MGGGREVSLPGRGLKVRSLCFKGFSRAPFDFTSLDDCCRKNISQSHLNCFKVYNKFCVDFFSFDRCRKLRFDWASPDCLLSDSEGKTQMRDVTLSCVTLRPICSFTFCVWIFFFFFPLYSRTLAQLLLSSPLSCKQTQGKPNWSNWSNRSMMVSVSSVQSRLNGNCETTFQRRKLFSVLFFITVNLNSTHFSMFDISMKINGKIINN